MPRLNNCSLRASDETRDFSQSKAHAPARPGDAPGCLDTMARLLMLPATSGSSSVHTDFQILANYPFPTGRESCTTNEFRLKVPNGSKWFELSQGFRFPFFEYCLQICLDTNIITFSGTFPPLLNFCYITIVNLGKLFWDLVMNLIPSLLLPYIFTEDCLFYSFSSTYLLQCHRKNQQVLCNN